MRERERERLEESGRGAGEGEREGAGESGKGREGGRGAGIERGRGGRHACPRWCQAPPLTPATEKFFSRRAQRDRDVPQAGVQSQNLSSACAHEVRGT